LKKIFPGIFEFKRRIYTKNLVPGRTVYGEKLVKFKGKEYREWNPKRSKLCAAIKKGLKETGLQNGSVVLYLGSAEGTTPSHVSDIIGDDGLLFGVDVSARVMRKFLMLCEHRENLFPIMASASKPELYENFVPKVDVLFQDVSQKNQSEIFILNAKRFLKKKGVGLLAVKARSIDVSKNPKKVFREEQKKLEKFFRVEQVVFLNPFEKDHALFFCRIK